MSEHKENQNPEKEKGDFESQVEKAETIAELLALVDGVMTSADYIERGVGGEKIALANRTGIKRFGRKAYYEAFEEKYDMAEMYMCPPDEIDE